MSVSYIPQKTRTRLWRRVAGRCEYEGCNRALWVDDVTKSECNAAYIAHIIADKPDGPRGDAELSKKLRAEISNLMLLCDTHHRIVDIEDVLGHPVERLREMKRAHEERITIVTSIQPEKKSEILLYGARIGEHHPVLNYEKATNAMIPDRFPADVRAIDVSLSNNPFNDCESQYWVFERESMRRNFALYVAPRLAARGIAHISVFAIGPQPLLIELGRLLSDIPAADVYELHREPPDWRWQGHPEGFQYRIVEPNAYVHAPALNLSLSGTINNDRITRALEEQHSVWTLTVDDPRPGFLRSARQLEMFRVEFRRLLDRVKAKHGEHCRIHLFPAVPVSIAVEIGRVWMPKADLPMRIYEQNRNLGGFVPVFDLQQ